MPVIRTDFPRTVKEIENFWITLSDGTRVAARMWLPDDAESKPVPAILEYIPYCKRDGTSMRDEAMHPYFAGHGYAAIRVDIRGSGESEGVIEDEYLPQELNDGVEIINWISKQPWCTGAVGMMGKSWGGFNALQVAALQPPALKCIITVASTDDRYADDVHYMGGCYLMDNPQWAMSMLLRNPRPADPVIVGEDWFDIWMKRLEISKPWIIEWTKRQTRDAFWKHGSVCENYDDIQVPVYAIGGWADGYTNAIPRLVENLNVFAKGQIGPWGHQYPHQAWPYPQAGFLQDAIRWWDHWLKGEDTGMMEEPRVQAYLESFHEPAGFVAERPGRWIATDQWPPAEVSTRALALNNKSLDDQSEGAFELSFKSPESTGSCVTEWMSYGVPDDLGEAVDQREDDAKSLCFETDILDEDLDIFGAVIVELEMASDKPVAQIAARLNEVASDGTSLRTTFGVLNLTHRDSHEFPEALEPGKFYKVRIKLNDTAHHFVKGNKIRLALSTNYWPVIWPAPEAATLTLRTENSRLLLPVRPEQASDANIPALPPAESHALDPRTTIRQGAGDTVTVSRTTRDKVITITKTNSDGRTRIDNTGWEHGGSYEGVRTIAEGNPNSCKISEKATVEWGREGEQQFEVDLEQTVWSDKTHFHIRATIHAKLDGNSVFSKSWLEKIERNLV